MFVYDDGRCGPNYRKSYIANRKSYTANRKPKKMYLCTSNKLMQ
jgi:hypothetical protein